MVGLALLGGFVYDRQPLVGTAILCMGPCLVILLHFYVRYNFSTTVRQIFITYFEVMAWMLILLQLVGFIDLLNEKWFGKEVQMTCSWPRATQSEQFLYRLSWVAMCSQLLADGKVDDAKGSRCPTKQVVDGRVGFTEGDLVGLANLTMQDPSTLNCPGWSKTFQDATRRIHVVSFEQGGDVFEFHNRSQLVSAYRQLMTRAVGSTEDLSVTFSAKVQTTATAAIKAYFRAGFLEELLKYIAVRRILFKDRVVDAGGVAVYGLAAGAGFASAENIQYALANSVDVMYVRMVLTIPLHCCTGLIIGIFLGYRKFLGWMCYCLPTLMVPVLIHGTFDFVLLLPRSDWIPAFFNSSGFRAASAWGLLFFAVVFARLIWLRLDSVCVVDIRSMMRRGLVSRPNCCCLECDCCSVWCVHQDPVLKAREEAVREQRRYDRLVRHRENCQGNGLERTRSQKSHRSQTSLPSSVGGVLVRQVTEVILPPGPPCQTIKATCKECQASVRAHLLFPSFCPHCSAKMPDDLQLGLSSTSSDSESA